MPAISFLRKSYIIRFQKSVEKLRRNAFRDIRHSNRVGVNKLIKMNRSIAEASMLLDRVSTEYEFSNRYILNDAKNVSDFKRLMSTPKDELNQLDTYFHEVLIYRIELISQHLSFLNRWFSQYLSLRNESSIYFLALVAGITALISIIVSLYGR